MGIVYTLDTSAVDWHALKLDLQADDFDNGRTPDELRRSFESSYASVFAWDTTIVVGTGRLLADGVCNALRDPLVSHKLARKNMLDRRRDALADERSACQWMLEEFDPAKKMFVAHKIESPEEHRTIARRCLEDLSSITRRWALFPVGRARRLVYGVHRLASSAHLPRETQQVIEQVRQHRDGSLARDRMLAARVRVEQHYLAVDDELEFAYPPGDGLAGTAFGNVLARTEHYSTPRYRDPLSELWPRLRLVASEKALAEVDEALVRLDFAVAAMTGAVLVVLTGSWQILFADATAERVWISLGAGAVAVAMYQSRWHPPTCTAGRSPPSLTCTSTSWATRSPTHGNRHVTGRRCTTSSPVPTSATRRLRTPARSPRRHGPPTAHPQTAGPGNPIAAGRRSGGHEVEALGEGGDGHARRDARGPDAGGRRVPPRGSSETC